MSLIRPISLTGKVIVITGASSGIGAATAEVCAAAGMSVVLAARREERLNDLARRIEDVGGRALAVTCDVSRDEDVSNLMARTSERFGPPYAVFANAGYGLCGHLLDTTDIQMREMFETNFFGTLRCVHAGVACMNGLSAGSPNGKPDRWRGHILICSSAVSEIGLPLYGGYAATKAAQDAVASALRAELLDERIYVSTVHPIGTQTEFFVRAQELSETGAPQLNTPKLFMQSPERVARSVFKCLQYPRPEVWPSRITRLMLALATAYPKLGAWGLYRMYRRSYQSYSRSTAHQRRHGGI